MLTVKYYEVIELWWTTRTLMYHGTYTYTANTMREAKDAYIIWASENKAREDVQATITLTTSNMYR